MSDQPTIIIAVLALLTGSVSLLTAIVVLVAALVFTSRGGIPHKD